MRVEKSVTSITWIPSEAIAGMPKVPFETGVAHYDEPPRRVSGKPFFRIKSASAWTTLALTVKADGTAEHALEGASPFPRHWLYDDAGNLVEKSGTIAFGEWYKRSHCKNTPWGDEDSPALTTAVESGLERELSVSIMREGKQLERRNLEQGEALVTEGDEGGELFLLLDGVVDIE